MLGNCADLGPEQQCSNHSGAGSGLLIAGLLGFGGFRVWELVDVFVGPATHNRQLHAIRRRLGYPDDVVRLTPYLSAPHGGGDGGVAGLTLRF